MSGIQPDNGVGPNESRNTITNPRLAAGCENLWYGPRCNPRMDPFAMNALIAEVLNAVNGSCACDDQQGIVYDCDRLDNLCRAIREHITDYLFRCCLPQAFPLSSDACSVEQLAFETDEDGCMRIVRLRQSGLGLGSGGTCNVIPPNTSGQAPANPLDPNTYYGIGALLSDALNNTIDESRLTDNRVASMTVNINCDNQLVDIFYNGAVIFDPKFNNGDGGVTAIVLRIDGDFLYVNPSSLTIVGRFTNFVREFVETREAVNLSAGMHTIDFYVVAATGLPPAPIQRTCSASSTGSVSVAARISVRS